MLIKWNRFFECREHALYKNNVLYGLERCYLYVLTKFTFIETIILYCLLSAQQTSSKKFDKEEISFILKLIRISKRMYIQIHCISTEKYYLKNKGVKDINIACRRLI